MKQGFLTHTNLTADVVVVGGGPAGVPCAIAAARHGAKVILCQNRPVLGGNASSEIRMHIVGANSGRKSIDGVMEARESGIIEEIRLENAYRNPQRSPSVFDLLLLEKVKAEPNITLLLNTSVIDARSVGGRIEEVTAIRASTEEVFHIAGEVFVDCSGDGAMAAAAGAAFMLGREDKEAFGESLAQDKADSKTLGSTLLFMGKQFDRPMRFIAPSWARKFTEADLKIRTHGLREDGSGLEYGYWWIEWGGQLDTIADDEKIRDELLAVVMGIWNHIKNEGDHGAQNWALDWFGVIPGKRESRRFIGQYVLRQSDLFEAKVFDDAIAYGGWPIDLHPPEGIDKTDEPPCRQHHLPYLYEIPLRSCLARDHSNLMFAGRNISATHVAFASTRVMATCAAMGEGVGVAAAYAVAHGIAPASLPTEQKAMDAIRHSLLRDDCYLIGHRDDGRGDLARSAKVSASSSRAGAGVEQLFSGLTRSAFGESGARGEATGWHRWMSQTLPASVDLAWEQPVDIDRVEIVWDSGLHRYMTLTFSDEYMRAGKIVWGQGQPEMAKAYTVEILTDGGWQRVAVETENWQRLRRHRVSATGVRALRVTVTEAWGIDHARMMTLRVFAPEQKGMA